VVVAMRAAHAQAHEHIAAQRSTPDGAARVLRH